LFLDSFQQRSILRMPFWRGICKCLVEVSEDCDGSLMFSTECLLPLQNLCNDGQPEFMDEWSAAIKCFIVAPKSWLGYMLYSCRCYNFLLQLNNFALVICF
jgi:hypothetical protein